MRKFKKKYLALALGVALLFSTIGCFPLKQNKNANNGKADTLTWYTIGKKQPDESVVFEKLNAKFKEKLNVTVKFEVIDISAYNDKMNLIIASGEPWDICFTSSWTNKYHSNVTKGAYLPLDELLEKSATNLKKSLPDYVWNNTKIDEKIYAVPNYQVLFSQNTQIVQKDLANKYNLNPKLIKKIQDFEPFLEEIKKNEPNLFPLRGYSPDIYYYEYIQPTKVVIKKDEQDYKAYNWFDTKEFKDYIKQKRDWFNKGYIRQDIATVTNDSADIKGGKYAVASSSFKPGGLDEIEARFGREYIEILMDEPYVPVGASIGSLNAINKNSNNPEKAIKLLELMNTDKEVYNLICFGIEGVHYDKISDNQIKVKKDSKYYPNMSWAYGNQFNAYLTETQQPGVWEETIKMNEQAKKSILAGFVFNTEPVKNELSQMATVEKEYSLLQTGSVDIEPMYSEFLAKYKKVGADKVLLEVQRQIDEWVKSKK